MRALVGPEVVHRAGAGAAALATAAVLLLASPTHASEERPPESPRLNEYGYVPCKAPSCGTWLQLQSGYVGPDLGTHVQLDMVIAERARERGVFLTQTGGIGAWQDGESWGLGYAWLLGGHHVARGGALRYGLGTEAIIFDRVEGHNTFGILAPTACIGVEAQAGAARIGLALRGRYRWHFTGRDLSQLLLSVTSRFEI